jgi:hypothetical protein
VAITPLIIPSQEKKTKNTKTFKSFPKYMFLCEDILSSFWLKYIREKVKALGKIIWNKL